MDKKNYSKRGNPYKRGKTWTYVVYVTNPLTGKKTPKYKGGFLTKKDAEAALKEAEAKALKEAVLNDLMLKNPCDSLKLPKKKRYKATILDTEQIKVLLNAFFGSDCELEVLIAITMGLQRGEVLGLRLQDFNFSKKLFRSVSKLRWFTIRPISKKHPEAETWGVAEVKTEKGNRELYVPQAVLDAVKQREYIVKRNRLKYGAGYKNLDMVCCHPDGNLISPQTVYHRFKGILKGTDLPDICFHDLRHAYVKHRHTIF